jgi:hypothetical protein
LSNPRITIETLLQRVNPKDIKNLEKQLSGVSSKVTADAKKLSKKQDYLAASAERLTAEYNRGQRAMVIWAAKVRIATSQVTTFNEGMQLGTIVLKDMFTKVGFLNAALNIFISRFGTMIAIFFVFRQISQFVTLMKESWEDFDTSFRRVSSLVISSSEDMGKSMKILMTDMVQFAIRFGVSLEQLSNTMFFLASAGYESAEIHNLFAAAQKLVIATSKDLTASVEENKKAVEIFAGTMRVMGPTLKGFNTEQDKANYLAGVFFKTFQKNQILLDELAVGLSFATSISRRVNRYDWCLE